MFKVFILLIMTTFTFTNLAIATIPPEVTAVSAIVLDQKTGRILYSKNINEKRPMASTTKIMTAIVALENGDMNDYIKVSKKASEIGGSSIWLEENEELTLEELLYGLMLKSGNDASYAIGEHIGQGRIDKFIDMMNKKAMELDAFDTSFKNTHGLDSEDHYTTAYDLARISAYGMNKDGFRTIVSTKEKNISWSTSQWDRKLKNTNKMLWTYDGSNGIKTGFTNKAGRCLVSSAKKNDLELISVVLHSNDIWSDSKTILDYAYDNYHPLLIVKKDEFIKSIQVINGIKDHANAYCKEEIILPVNSNEKDKVKIEYCIPDKIQAPTIKEQIVGDIKVYIGDSLIVQKDVYIKESIRKKSPNIFFRKFLKYWKNVS